MPARLVLIDGLPGSGKSTLAIDLGRALRADDRKVRVVQETEAGHPLHPVPTDAMGAAWADIHERIAPEEFASQSLARWSRFLSSNGSEDWLVVESFPFQSAVRVLLQIEASPDVITRYWADWTSMVQTHNPVLIYLRVDDIDRLITEITSHRGPEWTEYLFDAFNRMPYCASRGLTGAEAARTLLTLYSEWIDKLMGTRLLPKLEFEGRPLDYSRRLEAAIQAVTRLIATNTC